MLHRLSTLLLDGDLDRRLTRVLGHQERWARRRTAHWCRARAAGYALAFWSGFAALTGGILGAALLPWLPTPVWRLRIWFSAALLALLALALLAYLSARVFGSLLARELDRLESRQRDS